MARGVAARPRGREVWGTGGLGNSCRPFPVYDATGGQTLCPRSRSPVAAATVRGPPTGNMCAVYPMIPSHTRVYGLISVSMNTESIEHHNDKRDCAKSSTTNPKFRPWYTLWWGRAKGRRLSFLSSPTGRRPDQQGKPQG